jgi:hypothetical protein
MRSGRAVFPVSDTIYIEAGKIRSHRQRRDLREVIEHLSGYAVVTARHVISAHEVEALIDHRVGPNSQPVVQMDYLDWGIMRAFGLDGSLEVWSGDALVTEAVRTTHPLGPEAFDRLVAEAQLMLNRQVLEGPTPEEEPALRELGWNPEGISRIAKERAVQEVKQAARFSDDPQWRRGRIRDVVAARELYVEINERLYRGIAERGASLEELFPRVEDARLAFDSMPSFDAAVSLKTELHRDSNHRWRTNDIHDIDALGSTLPYCDVVVTDKAMAAAAHRAGLPARLETHVLAALGDIPSCL